MLHHCYPYHRFVIFFSSFVYSVAPYAMIKFNLSGTEWLITQLFHLFESLSPCGSESTSLHIYWVN